MPTLSDSKRAMMLSFLGLAGTNMSNADLEAAFWSTFGAKNKATQLLAGIPRLDEVLTLSSTVPTVTPSAPLSLVANSNSPAAFAGAVYKPFLAVGATAVVDTENDPNFEWSGNPVMSYGTPYPDYFIARPNLLTGGSLQGARWRPTLRFVLSGQKFAIRLKAFTTAISYKLKLNGRYVSLTSQTIAGLTIGNLYDVTFDLGSNAVRLIELEVEDPAIGGVWIEATASIGRPLTRRLRFVGFGDSITAGANGVGFSETWVRHAADLLGCEYNNLGIGGSGYLTANGDSFEQRIPDIVRAKPDVLQIFGVFNDAATKSYAAIYAAAVSFLSKVKQQLPSTFISVAGAWLTSDGYVTTLAAANKAIRDACTTVGLPFIDLSSPLGEASLYPAWSAINYEYGQVVSQANQVYMCIERGLTGGFTSSRFTCLGWIEGTGRVGATTGVGNADVLISNDGVHPTLEGHKLLGARFAGAITKLARA